MLNSVLLTSTAKIIRAGERKPCYYFIDFKFYSDAEGATFTFYPMMVDSFSIDRNYADNFGDIIKLAMTISPHDYALMQDQGQDLLCLVTLSFTDKDGRLVLDESPIQRQYNVMLDTAFDIRKSIPDVQAYTEPTYQTSVHLIEKPIYQLRHTKINTTFQLTTVEQAIYGVTAFFGIKKVHLTPPDNTHVFDHITIGSYQNISSVYGYLQSLCGVYTKGINSYIQDGCLFVYPALDTNPTYDKSTLLYLVDEGRYSGVDRYHAIENDTLSIVLNKPPQSYDMSIFGSENIGTGFVFNRASHVTDGMTTVSSTGGAEFTQEPAIRVSLINPRTLSKSNFNEVQIAATDNPYPKMSELVFYQASIMDFVWYHANPFIMDPCQKFIYYYDKNGTMVQKTGIMEKAFYSFERQQKVGPKYIYTCVGKIALRLSPNETETL